MININNYISEKLHLSKDTKYEKLPEEGDDVICLAIDKGDGEIRLFKQHINQIDEYIAYIVVTDDWGEYNLDINDKYKKYTCDYGDWIYVLYNLSLGLKLINEIIDYDPKLKTTITYDMHEFDIKKWTDYPVIYDELYIQKEYYNDLSQLKSELEHGNITEKLHLNKDSKCKKTYFEKGNKILPIQLDFWPGENKTKIVLIEPTEIIELKDDTITYKDNSWFGTTIEQKIQKNDKGYYEIRMGTQIPCVILNQDDGQDLLNEYLNMIKKEKKPTIIEFFRTKYFDEKDKEYFYKRYQDLIDNITSIKKYISII
jgi:hypothetical protein